MKQLTGVVLLVVAVALAVALFSGALTPVTKQLADLMKGGAGHPIPFPFRQKPTAYPGTSRIN